MKCHDVLGIRERASDEEIQSAYHKKAEMLLGLEGISPDLREKKLQQLAQAREESLSWREKPFSDKMSMRLSESVANLCAPGRMYACIGPCSCVDEECCGEGMNSNMESGCCATCCGFNCGMWADILMYGIIAVTAIVAISSDAKARQERIAAENLAKAERELQEKRLRETQRQQTRENCAAMVKNMMGGFSLSNLLEVSKYLNARPKTPDYTTEANYDLALSEIRKSEDEIVSRYEHALDRHSFFEARDYMHFIAQINKAPSYQNASKQLDGLCRTINHETPAPLSSHYGAPDKSFVESYGGLDCADIKDYQEAGCSAADVLWAFALAEPFDPFLYSAWANEFPAENESKNPSVDLLASMIYVKGRFGVSSLATVNADLSVLLQDAVKADYPAESIRGLASVAAWSGDKEDERVLLEALSKRKEWTGELSSRLSSLVADMA